MIKGHLDQQCANLRSTKPAPFPPTTELPVSDPTIPETATKLCPQLTNPPALRTHHLYVDCQIASGRICTDQSGRFRIPATRYARPVRLRQQRHSRETHEGQIQPSDSCRLQTSHYFTDTTRSQTSTSEASATLQQFIASVDVAAEQAIRTFKTHFTLFYAAASTMIFRSTSRIYSSRKLSSL
jgi:hypothetical protein